MNEEHMLEVIRNLEPDFDPIEEMIIEHYRLKYTNLQVRQMRWWLAELSRLESMLPMGSAALKRAALCDEARDRNRKERGE